MNYPSIRIEGAILSPDILEHLVDGAKGQGPKDFGLESGTKVKDEIARAWADAQDYWRIFQRKLKTVKEGTAATTETRQNWIIPLLGLLRYDVEFQKSGTEIHGKNYAISHRVTNRANTPLHIVGYNDDAGLDRKGSQRMSAHALVQQYLNLADELYGVVTNGRVIRLLRDSSRLVKQSYLEFDLDRIFTDGLFADFAILFRLLHATRLPAKIDEAAESLIEKYHQDSLDSGARIRDGLSAAVENAIKDFGNGFLANSANQRLRTEITEGRLTPAEYYRSLLRLIYRLLFLMVIEERDLVFPTDVPKAKRDVYRQYYSVLRLRLLAEKRYLADKRHHDLWMALVSTFRLFEADGPGEKLGIKPLAGDLFSPAAIAPIFNARLGNDVLLRCLRSLGLYERPDTKTVSRINYGGLNVEEFGSVYEGLLKLQPVVNQTGISATFSLVPGPDDTQSHYTEDVLVQPLIKHSLDYLIEDRVKAENPEAALLDLRVADIACGSGHILLAAARRIATELATVRTGEEQPSPTAYRQALRDVIRNCIYGVDVNPLAVELCKVALWLEAHNPGEPLNFLDHHIKCGNAIVGYVSKEEVDLGVPEEAFAKMPGDDAEFLKAVRKKNKDERRERTWLEFPELRIGSMADLLKRWREISAMPERNPGEIASKKTAFERFSNSGYVEELRKIASIPIAQFFIPKTSETKEKLITDAEFRDYWTGERQPNGQSYAEATVVAERQKFFHWFLEFPNVIERGGFDCILGNPPYLGGGKLSTVYGNAFNLFVKSLYEPATGQVDLIGYFIRRIFQLLSSTGVTAIIGTKTVAQGDTRIAGLQKIVDSNGAITFAFTAVRWPGTATVDVVLVGFCRDRRHIPVLNGRYVPILNSSLADAELYDEPAKLRMQYGIAFKGSEPVGDGFLLERGDAERMIRQLPDEAEAIQPFLIGDDVSSSPIHQPSRYCLYLGTASLAECSRRFPGVVAHLERFVYPQRLQNNDRHRREVWWQFSRPAERLYLAVGNHERTLVLNRNAKYLAIAMVPSTYVFADVTIVIAKESWRDFAVYSSNIHESWAWFRGSTLGSSTLRYTPTTVFETFVEPQPEVESLRLEPIGENYHEHRRELMLSLWLGLTKIYNLFHDPDLSEETVQRSSGKDEEIAREGYAGLLELRHRHVEMDNAVRDAYGWQDLNLEHGFHEVETLPENDRTRYTISPTARKEVLKRLLALNHARAAEEEAQAAAAKPVKKKGERKSKKSAITDGENPLLGAGPLFE